MSEFSKFDILDNEEIIFSSVHATNENVQNTFWQNRCKNWVETMVWIKEYNDYIDNRFYDDCDELD